MQGQALIPVRVLLVSLVSLVGFSARDIAVVNTVITALLGALRSSVLLLAGMVVLSLRQRIARRRPAIL